MITKRIIPCLDVKDGRVVKGVNFAGLQDMADPVEMARYYNEAGADELVFYDITASVEGRALFTDILRRVASEIFIPLTVGGGIRTLEDFDRVLKCGADQSQRQLRRHRRPRHHPGGPRSATATSASCSRPTSSGWTANLCCLPRAGARKHRHRRAGLARAGRAQRGGGARRQLHRHRRRQRAGSTWNCWTPWPSAAPCPSSRRAGPASRRISSRCSATTRPSMPGWRRPSSTPNRSASATSSATCAKTASKCGCDPLPNAAKTGTL